MKKYFVTAAIISCMVLLFLNPTITSAQDSEWECINSDSKTDYLVKQFKTALKESPISQAIHASMPTSPLAKTEADSMLAKPCSECTAAQLKIPTSGLESFKDFFKSGSRINLICMKAARQFSAPTNEIMCPEGTVVSSKGSPAGKGPTRKANEPSGACMTLPMLDYQARVYESMYRCIRKYSSAPFNPSTIFEIVSRESTFKPNFSSSAGHGAGQLTSMFVDDVQQSWRGKPTIEAIAKDSSPECGAAQKLALGDLSKTLKLGRDRCEFIQYGSGMERNALWMMVGLDTLWRKNITPSYSGYLNKYKNHKDLPQVMEKMLQLAYGRSGIKGMHALLSQMRDQNGPFPPDRILRELAQAKMQYKKNPTSDLLTDYLSEVSTRQDNIASRIDSDPSEKNKSLKARFTKQGANACIE